jgi:hypothetical protein
VYDLNKYLIHHKIPIEHKRKGEKLDIIKTHLRYENTQLIEKTNVQGERFLTTTSSDNSSSDAESTDSDSDQEIVLNATSSYDAETMLSSELDSMTEEETENNENNYTGYQRVSSTTRSGRVASRYNLNK